MGCSGSTAVVVDEPKTQFHDYYKLGKKLGEGAFGQVRVAKAKTSGAELAVKIVDVRRTNEQGELTKEADHERLMATKNEIHLWEAVGSNDYCVRLQRSFYDKNLFYMVMEKCEGSLMDKLAKMSSLIESDLARIFSEMLKGIAHVHSVDVAHRDIKPDNFLLGGPAGNTVKLCDFGLAAKVPPKGLLKGVYGTAPYMSPEMLQGNGYDKLTDVWSLGATAFLMIHGDFPYVPEETTAAAMKKAILAGKPEIKFARPPDEEEFFSRSFVDSATPFLQALLQRSPLTRASAAEALKLPFLSPHSVPSTVSADPVTLIVSAHDAPLGPAIRKARKATAEIKKPINPIVQRNLDELLQKLHTSCTLFFSETNEENMDKCASLKQEPADDRIRKRSESRHSTHSGVVSGVVAPRLLEFKVPNSPTVEELDSASTVTPGSAVLGARTNTGSSPALSAVGGGAWPPRADSLPESVLETDDPDT